MTIPAFVDRAAPPDDASLTRALGKTKPQWDAVVAFCAGHDGVATEWKFYGAAHGWQLKAVQRKRAIVYLVPRAGHFTAGVALPDAALDALRAADLPADLVAAVAAAKPAPEGRPARVEVRDRASAAILEKLIAIKARTVAPGVSDTTRRRRSRPRAGTRRSRSPRRRPAARHSRAPAARRRR